MRKKADIITLSVETTSNGMPVSTVGVIGGMGPDASNRFCQLITSLTDAVRDQDHIPVIHFSNPLIPSRFEAKFRNGADPTPALIQTARTLEKAGAHFLVMPCNSAHIYLDTLRGSVRTPVLSMIEETANYIVREVPQFTRFGILATSQTLETSLYQTALNHLQTVVPDSKTQALVMEAIYDAEGLKAGKRSRATKLLKSAVNELVDAGAQCILTACTEISLVTDDLCNGVPVIDPMTILAAQTVCRAKQGFGIPNIAYTVGRSSRSLRLQSNALAQRLPR